MTASSTSRITAISESVRSARAVSRSRDVPAGTDGGRKQPVWTPRSRHQAAASSARCGSPSTRDTTADSGRGPPVIVASSRARARTVPARAGSRFSTARAALAAPTDAGARPVSKMNDRAVSMRCSRTRASASTAPPCPPRDFDRVAVTTMSGCPARPASCTSPLPPSPRTPSPCASSTSRTASRFRHTRCSARSGARSPSALNTESVITRARSSPRSASARSTASTSAWGAMYTRARESRHASTSDAWLPASETMRLPRPASPVTAPRLAV